MFATEREGNSERNYCPPAFKLSLLREKQPKSIIQTEFSLSLSLLVAVLQSISGGAQKSGQQERAPTASVCIYFCPSLCVRSSAYLKEKPHGI
jgi:hypothetical protein